MKKYEKIIKVKKTKDNEKLLDLMRTIKGVKIRKNIFTNTYKVYCPPIERNPKLSGTGTMLYSEDGKLISGIIHK